MATGDTTDILARLKSALPTWFADSTPNLNALLNAYATTNSFIYSGYSYSALQTRIKTATDVFLDLISADFFGNTLPRKQGETDAAFRNRILINILRERGTRHAIIQVLTDLTGNVPKVFEPQRPADTGGYGIGGVGYDAGGGYGSLYLPYQAFVTAYRPLTSGIPYVAGYGTSPFGYSVASRGEWADLSMVQGNVLDADIYSAIDSVKTYGTTLWTRISNPLIEYSFISSNQELILDNAGNQLVFNT